MKAAIVCSGNINDYNAIKEYISSADYIISVDGGARHLRNMNIVPDLMVGDFDSVNMDDFDYYRELGVPVDRYPSEKDMTDSELAIERAIEKGASELVLLGALGSIIDHSIAHVLMLKQYLDRGITVCIADEKNELYMSTQTVTFNSRKNKKLSIIPISETVTGVSTEGLKYPLDNATMKLGTTWGVSNEFINAKATVSIGEGIVLICLSQD